MQLHALQQLWAGWAADPREPVMLAVLAAGAVTDLRTWRIPNVLTAGGALAGLLLALAWPRGLPPLQALAGLGVAALLLLPLRVPGVLGAGDVKLMMAAGAFLGPIPTLFATLGSLVAGGALALGLVLWRRPGSGPGLRLAVALAPGGMTAQASLGRLPFGVAILLGCGGWLLVTHHLIG